MASRRELRTKDRIRKGLPRYSGILSQAMQRGISEEDTSTIIQSMLVDILGYDRFEDITGQFAVRGKWADWAVRCGDTLHFLVEVKSLGAKLRERDLFQVVSYSRQYGLEWTVLTTGDVWQCHRVPGGEDAEQFFEIRLLDPSQSEEEKVECFYLLSKDGFARAAIQEQWQKAQCFRPLALARILLSEEVLRAVRRALRREHPGRQIDVPDVKAAITRSVIRGDLYTALESDEPSTSPRSGRRTKRRPDISGDSASSVRRGSFRGGGRGVAAEDAGPSTAGEPWKTDGRAWHMGRLTAPVRVALERLMEVLGDHVTRVGWEQAYYVWLRGRKRNLRVHTALKGNLEIGLHPASENEAVEFLAGYPDLGLTPRLTAGYKTSPFVRPEIGPSFPSDRMAAMFAQWLDGGAAPRRDD
jgi:hypothetical protein